MRLGPLEIALILVIVLIVFGAGKLPQVGRELGRAIRSFKEASHGEGEQGEKAKAGQKEADKASSSTK